MAIDKLEVEQVRHYKDELNLSFERIAELMSFSERTARRRYKASLYMHEGRDVPKNLDTIVEFPEVQPVRIVAGDRLPMSKGLIERFKPLEIAGDAMVMTDLHIPLHDPWVINEMFYKARENGIRQWIIGGDYFHMDVFSSFLPHQPEAALEVEREDGLLAMKTALRYFDKVYFAWGNHDFRLVKKLGFTKSFEECMRWMLQDLTEDEMSKITFTDLDYVNYYPHGDTWEEWDRWRICHPRNFSSVPLTVPRKLASKYGCNIITGHSHHCAIGMATDGRNICIEAGGAFDKNRTEYIQKTTAHHEWVQGFVMFKDGVPTVFSPSFGNI